MAIEWDLQREVAKVVLFAPHPETMAYAKFLALDTASAYDLQYNRFAGLCNFDNAESDLCARRRALHKKTNQAENSGANRRRPVTN